MCSEMGSRYTGMLLLALAIMAIITNLLLYFPSGQVLEPAKITDLIWLLHGFLGAGLLSTTKSCQTSLNSISELATALHLDCHHRLPDPTRDNYLFNQPTWATCQEPEHIVLWNVVLLSIFLGIGVVEAVLCVSQVASELYDIFCGTYVRKGQVNITDF
ncbi:transmembrane 4 L6 family member 1-like [Mirounga leonina]|uniref:transmembrane 4 L6 family member 1-like n=1 Tax=Mirounga leonina TaxID=9715 RepID=UPI00156C0FF6|nr:transmembrane 4 L6 family member 1-like [Mirounga leonina]